MATAKRRLIKEYEVGGRVYQVFREGLLYVVYVSRVYSYSYLLPEV